jgi:hypothetical protein
MGHLPTATGQFHDQSNIWLAQSWLFVSDFPTYLFLYAFIQFLDVG